MVLLVPLTETIKTHITDSEIVKNMKLHREKARQITVGGLGEHFQQETIKKMKNADAFSIGIDKSVVNKRSELEITVKLASRVLVLYKANYKSSPMQVLFFLGLLHDILRSLAAF